MNTFHIDPRSDLAAEVADEVRAFSADTLIAVRGQDFDYGDGDIVETVYTVSPCPNQDDTSGYCWTYVQAGDWIAEFDAIQEAARQREDEGQKQAAAHYASILQLLADLDAAEDSDEDEAARQRIADHPLHVLVRSDWTQPCDPLEAAEFQILLCTGGPAVRIVGELEHGTPCSAQMEHQTWDTEWLPYFGALPAVLCDYASNFHFGD